METTKTLFKESWLAPSNIALVKYWGKLPVQIPANPSISFTLKNSITQMSVEVSERIFEEKKFKKKILKDISLDFFFEKVPNDKFKEKILKFLESITEKFPWLLTHHFVMYSENTFPHSSGIASSASSMSALALCLLALDEKITGKKRADFFREASELARLASGSAGRSLYPFMASWGEESVQYASPVLKESIDSIFHEYCDSIVIVDAAEKSVSSRAGHSLMEKHPFKQQRFKRANENLNRLMSAMKKGEMDTFIEVVEEEALMLHALMMTSTPSYILLKPNSLLVIEKIREYRSSTNTPVCFTIDAGPNIHVLYPKKYEHQIKEWLRESFREMKVIHDEVGTGPSRLRD